jgi:hypothetical protein
MKFSKDNPPCIHQIWWQGVDKIPPNFHEFQKSWIVPHQNPNWYYRCWDEQMFVNWMKPAYPKFASIYNLLRDPLQKCYFAQYLILFHYGGAFVHLDIECSSGSLNDAILGLDGLILIKHYALSKLEPLISSAGLINARFDPLVPGNEILTTKFMASSRFHVFWYFVIKQISKTIGSKVGNFESYDNFIRCTVGDIFLSKCYSLFRKSEIAKKTQQPIHLLNWGKVFAPPNTTYLRNMGNRLKKNFENVVLTMQAKGIKIQSNDLKKYGDATKKIKLIDHRVNFKKKDSSKMFTIVAIGLLILISFIIIGIISFSINSEEKRKKLEKLRRKELKHKV